MSLFNTLSTGASGLSVSTSSMAVIGDNIANINTIGFKSSRASFADLLPADVGGLGGTSQVGVGARMAGVSTSYAQGSLQGSSSALDMAISGGGFFMVSSGEADYYTRDGSFYMDTEGYLVNSTGLRLQGYGATDGDLTSIVGDMQLDTTPVPGEPTSEVTLDAVLSAEAEYTDEDGAIVTPLADLNVAGGGVSIEDAAAAADYSTSVTIYDSLGVPHDVTILMERTGENDWSYQAVVDAGELPGGVEGEAFVISSGDMAFDTDGVLQSMTQTDTATAWNFEGAGDMQIDLLFGADAGGNETEGGMTMSGSESSVTAITQDGHTTGELTGITVDDEGIITGVYSNGESEVLGQVAMATFASDAGLTRGGGNLYRATADSGQAAVGAPGSGGRGAITAYALEKSNVDLEAEFVSMIEAQRTYQANARVVTTANETLQELVNLV